MLVRRSERQQAKKLRRMTQQNPEEVLIWALMAAGRTISPDMADKLVEEGIVSTKNVVIFYKNRINIIASQRARNKNRSSY